jgi:peptide chain release factor subunit 1
MVVDSSPYLRLLARIQDEWESFTLLLISSNYAKMFSVSMGEVKSTKKLSADIMNRHKKGGWSQARFNRLRRGAIHAFFSEVEEALKKMADERIVLAGPGQAKLQFREMLPKNLKDNIVDIIDIDIDDEVELMKKSKNIISEKEELKSHEAVELLKTEILKDRLVVYGIKETLDAVKNGQVELLLLEKNYTPRGWICENCQVVEERIRQTCPYCGRKTSEVDIIEEILEFAERTDADVEFTDDKELAKLGHVGAILRFK